jgi:carbon storage regulator
MLVLTRKTAQRIFIGQGDGMIVLTLIDVWGDKAKIGIEAPDHVIIDREEVRARIERQGREDERRGL